MSETKDFCPQQEVPLFGGTMVEFINKVSQKPPMKDTVMETKTSRLTISNDAEETRVYIEPNLKRLEAIANMIGTPSTRIGIENSGTIYVYDNSTWDVYIDTDTDELAVGQFKTDSTMCVVLRKNENEIKATLVA